MKTKKFTMKNIHYLIFIFYSFVILLTPSLVKASDEQRCFVTNRDACIFNGLIGNFGLDLSNEYSLQQLLAEIAVKYAQAGNIKQAQHIAEALTHKPSKNAALSALQDLSQQNQSTFQIKKITEAQKQQILEAGKSAKDDEAKVRVSVEMAECGLFEESENLRKTISNEVFQSLILIQLADIYISIDKKDIAQEKLAQAVELAMSLKCNVYPCSDDYNGRILERVPRPEKPRL
jgi:hypothetical protein